MRVIAVDPGYDRLGVAIIEHSERSTEHLVYSTCIETDKHATLPDRIHTLGVSFEKLLTEYAPDALAIETLFFNKNQKTAIGVAQARGVCIYLANTHACAIYEYGPQEIKIAVTGHGGSSKQQVIDIVQRLIPTAPKKALDDEYDAIAVGITCLACNRS